MSKFLSGNGRWETKFVSPEHREQYNEQTAANKAPAQQLSQETLKLVRESVLLPILMSVIEKNRQEIERSKHSLKGLYMASANALLDVIHADLVKVRRELREQQIKVIEEDRIDDAMHYRFICRGYEHKFSLMRFVVLSEINARLGRYIEQLFSK